MASFNTLYMKQYNYVIRIIVIIIVILLLWSFVKDGIKPFIIRQLGGYTSQTTIETVDTLSVKYETLSYKFDSIKTYVRNLKAPKKEKIYIHIKDYVIDTTITSITNKGELQNINKIKNDSILIDVYTFENPISDTLLDGNIKTILDFNNCKIVEQSFLYKLKDLKINNKVITIEKKVENTIENKSSKIGVGLQATSNKNIGINAAYLTKSNWQFQGGILYEPNNNNQYTTNNTSIFNIGILKFF